MLSTDTMPMQDMPTLRVPALNDPAPVLHPLWFDPLADSPPLDTRISPYLPEATPAATDPPPVVSPLVTSETQHAIQTVTQPAVRTITPVNAATAVATSAAGAPPLLALALAVAAIGGGLWYMRRDL